MEKVICPNCGKASYTASPQANAPCPYCGHPFQTEEERRCEPRRREKEILVLLLNSEAIPARTVDISPRGIGLELRENPNLRPGEQVILDIHSLQLRKRARLIWLASEEEKVWRGGLEFLETIPA